MQEEWKDVLDFEGLYMISNFGRVKSVSKNVIMKPQNPDNKYFKVVLSKQGQKKSMRYIHRMVAQAFLPNPEGKSEVNHIDEDKTNNHVSNLNWMTHKENNNWGTKRERGAKNTDYESLAIKNSKSVIAYKNGIGNMFPSYTKAKEELGLGETGISEFFSGKIKSHKGYTFKRVKVYGGGVSHV